MCRALEALTPHVLTSHDQFATFTKDCPDVPLQVIFFDKTEAVLSSKLHTVTYVDKRGQALHLDIVLEVALNSFAYQNSVSVYKFENNTRVAGDIDTTIRIPTKHVGFIFAHATPSEGKTKFSWPL